MMPYIIKISKLKQSDKDSICKIADWYFNEWDTPIEKTIERLSSHPNNNTILQAIVTIDGKIVATGGLCNIMNIYKTHPELEELKPWIGLLYTEKEYRNKGIGQQLLKFIEQNALEIGLKQIFIYTFTAESFYMKNGWTKIRTVEYKNHQTAVMEKILL